jgi:hypothetical protein
VFGLCWSEQLDLEAPGLRARRFAFLAAPSDTSSIVPADQIANQQSTNMHSSLAALTDDQLVAPRLSTQVVEGVAAQAAELLALAARVHAAREPGPDPDDQTYRDAMVIAGLSDKAAIGELRSAGPKPKGWQSAFESDLPIEKLEAGNRELEQHAALEQRELIDQHPAPAEKLAPNQKGRLGARGRERRPSCARRRGSRRITRGSPCGDDSDPGGDPEPELGPAAPPRWRAAS